MPERTETEFDAHSAGYRDAVEESIAFSGAGLDFFTRAKADALLGLVTARVGSPEGLGFLDLGCGPGETDRFLAGRVARLAGVDVAPEMVARARERNPWAEYRSYAPGEPIPYEDASFDVSFAICVFHHVERARRLEVVREMARVTRPRGLIVLFEHNPLNPLTRKAVRGCEFDRDADLLTRRTASRLLEQSGLGQPDGRYILFFTRESGLLRGIERRLGWLPLGAQYAVFAQRP